MELKRAVTLQRMVAKGCVCLGHDYIFPTGASTRTGGGNERSARRGVLGKMRLYIN
jgi:hypothetical protein